MAAEDHLKKSKASDQNGVLESDSSDEKPNTDLKVIDKLAFMGKNHSMKLISSESVVVPKRRKINSQTSSQSQDKDSDAFRNSN